MSENAPKTNPLKSILRQPKVYIRLPSKGKYWPEGSLNPSVNGEYPVYSMTAKDELLLKTPDALLNGQGVVEVIQNCVPNVVNAWGAPAIDIDTLLVAVRLATYGETIPIKINHPAVEDGTEYDVNIREILDTLQSQTSWDDRFEITPELVVHLKPLDYKTQTEAQMSEFETSRIVGIVRDDSISEDEKVKAFAEAFGKLSQKTISIVAKAVYKIESTAGVVEEPEFIQEFIEQCDAEIFEKIKDRLGILNDLNKLKPLKIQSTPEMIASGAPEIIEVPFSFDESNFFA